MNEFLKHSGEVKLATTLFAASVFTRKLRDTIKLAWEISEPFMKEKDDD